MRRLRTLGCLIVLCISCIGAVRAQEVGTIAELEGTAEIERGGTRLPATAGMSVQLHDEIRSGHPGRVVIVFQDQSVIALAEGSHLRIDEQVFNPNQGTVRSMLKLFKGKIRALVSDYYHQAASEYQLETPTAVSGVRGTDFIMTYDPDGEYSEVVGVSGRVEVHSSRKRNRAGVFVSTRELTRIESGRPPSPVRLLDQAVFLRYLEGVKLISGSRSDSLANDNAMASGKQVPAALQADAILQTAPDGNAASPDSIVDSSLPPDGLPHAFHDPAGITQPPAVLDAILHGPGDIGVRF